MADTHINIGGTWKAIDAAYVNIGGAWKTVQSIYVNIGGTWKKAWDNFVVSLSGTSGSPALATATTVTPQNCLAGIRLSADGTLNRYNNVAASWQQYLSEWGTPTTAGVGNNYWVRATKQSGVDPNNVNAGFGTWLQLSTNREWSHLQSGIGAVGPTVIKLEIATDSGGSTIVATGYWSITATVEGTS